MTASVSSEPRPPRQQPAHQFLARDVEVDRGLHLRAEGTRRREGRLGLLDGAREPVEDVPARLDRGDDGLAQHVHHDAIGNQVAAVEVGLDRPPERRLVLDVLSQQVTAGDVGDPEPFGQLPGLRALAGAGRADQQKAHQTTSAARDANG